MSNLTLVPRRLEVVDAEGAHVMWCDEETAHTLIKARQVRPIHDKHGRIRVLKARETMEAEFGSLDGGRGTAFDKTRYSHNHETADNPEKVWTLKRLPDSTRKIFTAVLDECRAA